MILFTSVTKRTFGKACIIYLGIAVFCVLFTFVYEKFSYGESSTYMRFMFLAPLAGALLSFLSNFNLSWLSNRAAFLLFNSTIAIVVSGCLMKGIIEVSGRTTTYEQPYWYVALAFLALSVVTAFFIKAKPKNNRRSESQ